MKSPVVFTLLTPKQQRQKARLLIRALLEAGSECEAASTIRHRAKLKQAERATDRAITRAYRYMTGEAPPSDQDLVDFIYGEPE
jgi:regulator of RNase E activity RraB